MLCAVNADAPSTAGSRLRYNIYGSCYVIGVLVFFQSKDFNQI